QDLTGERRQFHELADEAKLEQATTTFQPEVERLRRVWDAPKLDQSLAALPIYRTYVTPPSDADPTAAEPTSTTVPLGNGTVADADREAIAAASARGMPAEVADRLTLDAAAPAEFV